MPETLTPQEERAIRNAVARANEQGWGIALGALFGIGLFLATVLLVIRGGDVVGPHLGLLAIYFPGYSVTWIGSVVGFVYAFVLGYAIGRSIATLYNRLIPS